MCSGHCHIRDLRDQPKNCTAVACRPLLLLRAQSLKISVLTTRDHLCRCAPGSTRRSSLPLQNVRHAGTFQDLAKIGCLSREPPLRLQRCRPALDTCAPFFATTQVVGRTKVEVAHHVGASRQIRARVTLARSIPCTNMPEFVAVCQWSLLHSV